MSSLGLGIDCGGTYTDAVIYDLDERTVLASAKYPTSHHQLISCIEGVLDALPADLLHAVQLASVSTTLATNAIVEGKGGRAALILIGYEEDTRVNNYGARVARIAGGHDSRGNEAAPLDDEEVRQAVMQHAETVDAFAISGYFSIRNPEHEKRAARIAASVTSKPIVCGHELSMHLDAPKRATTAAINARLIPLISNLITATEAAMEARGIKAPLMIVRGDGTLMGVDIARERPVETILSGPAASVVGALTLTGRSDGLVIDVGGTTTDIAHVEGGLPRIKEAGAVVGGLATQVEAIDIRTMGLGGDSLLKFRTDGELEIGPRRVLPIAMLPSKDWVKKNLQELRQEGRIGRPDDWMAFWTIPVGKTPEAGNGNGELLRRASERPLSYLELKNQPRPPYEFAYELALVQHLELSEDLLLAALTPTDVFNYIGEMAVGDTELSRLAVETAAAITGQEPSAIAEKVKEQARETIVYHLLKHLLDAADSSRKLLEAWSQGRIVQGVELSLRLVNDILAVGAPADIFLAPVAERLGCGCVTPPYMEVANAVGAVAGVVSHSESVIIRHQPDEGYTAHASDGRYDFDDINAASDFARAKAAELATALAHATGAGGLELDERIEEFTTASEWGKPMVLERVVQVRAFGRPRLG